MQIPFYPADILLPKKDFEKWSVVACDQYTSNAAYWRDLDEKVGDFPSTLRITLPEIFLEEENVQNRIDAINESMKNYLENDVFDLIENSFVYVERTLRSDRVRKGIVGAIDLEEYDFNANAETLIRATEKTVPERIPPRVKIRKNAPLELPHVMILIDDPACSVIEPLSKVKNTMKTLYDFKLMKHGGFISGWKADGHYAEDIILRLSALKDRTTELAGGKPPLFFAVGDGNHSLATAKTCWEEIKKTLSDEEKQTHPARYALAEIVNLHDESLEFEPIHRVVFDTNEEKFLEELNNYFGKDGLVRDNCDVDEHNDFIVISASYEHIYEIVNRKSNLTVGDVQEFLDYYVKNIDTNARIDYIHGDGVAIELGEKGNIALLMPVMPKSELFKTVMIDGVLPRKTFSMGEADDKRFYLEAKKIK